MDATLQKLTDFTFNLEYTDLTPEAIHECKRRLIDSLACAIGGFSAEPCVIARAVAGKASYLVTGDSDLQGLTLRQCAIVTPEAFMRALAIKPA